MIIREMRRGGKNVQGSTVVLCAFVRVILRKNQLFFPLRPTDKDRAPKIFHLLHEKNILITKK